MRRAQAWLRAYHTSRTARASTVLTGFVNGRWQFSTPLHRIHTPLPITKEMLLVVTSATPTADDDAYWPPTLARPLKFEFQNSKMANGQRFENR